MKVTHLIGDKKEKLWQKQDFSKIFRESVTSRNATEHFDYLKAQNGEKIAFVNSNDEILGWIGLIPDQDRRGKYYILSGHEVRSDYRGLGIGAKLLEEAKKYLKKYQASRLKFGTSPLLTVNASLYITRYGAQYTWNDKIKLADGKPWPYVSCECNFNNPLKKPLELSSRNVLAANLLEWDGLRPKPIKFVRYTGGLSILLPPISKSQLRTATDNIDGFLETTFNLFDSLNRTGYGFIWFDKLKIEGNTFYYYYLSKELNILTF